MVPTVSEGTIRSRPVVLLQRLRAVGGGASLVPLVLLFGLNAVDELDRAAFGLLLPEIRDHFNLSLTGTTLLSAAIVPASLLVAVPVARLADRTRRVPIALTGATAWAVFSVLTGLAPTVVLLALARIGAGVGRAVNDPVHGSLLSDFYVPSTRAKVFAVHRSANTVGAFLGPLIAGFVAAAVGWRVPFFVLALPTFALILFALASLREPERTGERLTDPSARFREAFATLWRVRTLRRIWLAFPFISFVAIGLGQIFSLYYDEVFNVTVRDRGIIQSFDAPFIVLGLLLGAPLIDRGIKRDAGHVMRLIGLVGAGIGVFILGAAVAPVLGIGVACSYAINVVATVLYAGGFAIVSLVAPPEARASAFAFFNISSLFGIVALPMVGIIGDAVGLRAGMAALVPMLLIGGLIIASAGRFVNADIDRVHPEREREIPDPLIPPAPPAPAE
jgi:branched-chain amino acid transport system ATP-binding protein